MASDAEVEVVTKAIRRILDRGSIRGTLLEEAYVDGAVTCSDVLEPMNAHLLAKGVWAFYMEVEGKDFFIQVSAA